MLDMTILQPLLDEGTEEVNKLRRIKEKILKEIEKSLKSELEDLVLRGVPDLKLHELLTELAYADIDCSEHFTRFPDEPGIRETSECKDDWKRCWERKDKAMHDIVRVAILYVKIASDVMET